MPGRTALFIRHSQSCTAHRRLSGLLTCLVLAGTAVAQDAGAPVKTKAPATTQNAAPLAKAAGPLDFTVTDIDGQPVPLSKYRGQVVMIVNVASKCGLTPQYEQLQALHEKYAGRGLKILAFPANDFNRQEPGSNAEIKDFCHSKYHVGFDLFSKIAVKGDAAAELYKFLTSSERNAGFGGEIRWNFTKFLIGRDGRVVQRFEPKVKPDDPQVVEAIEQALASKPPPADTGGAPAPKPRS